MAQFKVVVSDPETGKSEVIEAKDSTAQFFVGRHIGEIVDMSALGQNYKVKITGGSDRAGFPMRGDVLGSGKRYVLMTEGIGFRNSVEGEKRRKLVRGGTISEEIYQLNVAKWQEPQKAPATTPTVAPAPAPAPAKAPAKSK
jgi:small subunit ribosomal protein S6e